MIRVVSLVPSLTDALAEMGRDACVVGRTRYCPAPRDGASTLVGGTKDPDVPAILGLAPDVVFAVKEENRREDVQALLAAGVSVYVYEPRRIEDVPALAWSIGRLVGAAREGAAMAARTAAAIRMARQRAAARPRKKCAYLVWRKPWRMAGPATYVADLLRACGLDGPLAERPDRYPEVEPGDLTAAGLDLALFPSEPFPFRAEDLAEFRAAAHVPEGAPPAVALCRGDLVGWYPARTAEALRHVEEIAAETKP